MHSYVILYEFNKLKTNNNKLNLENETIACELHIMYLPLHCERHIFFIIQI